MAKSTLKSTTAAVAGAPQATPECRQPFLYLIPPEPDREKYRIEEPGPDVEYTTGAAAGEAQPGEGMTALATDLCDQMDNLHAVNHYFFATLEAYFADAEQQGLISEGLHYGLFLHIQWLQAYSKEVTTAVHHLHKAITDRL